MSNILPFIPYLKLISIILIFVFSYKKLSKSFWIILLSIYAILQLYTSITCFIFCTTLIILFFIPKIRILLITKPIMMVIKKLKLLPKISDTEKTVLRSGSVWIDKEFFSGNPDFKHIFLQKYPKLTKIEKSFLDNEVEELCRICDDTEVYKNNDLPENIWQFIKENKMFGIIIPKKYEGLQFSAFAHSEIIQKLSSRSVPLAITVMVPNSLGPSELLLHYGTKKQKEYYLPRLANGQEIPCFALTEPEAGSDATSINSEGVIFKDKNNELKIKLNWNKRYITLGAIATIIGLAFKLKDPDNLLGKDTELGITCALIPYDTPGIVLGRRHDPLSTPFINSPINGNDVIIGFDAIIGEEKGIGQGWKMLMECLAAGRGISLPSTSSGGVKLATRVITAYSSIRKQFGIPIGKFEGVEEVIARILGKTYTIEAVRKFTAGAVDSGIKPSVISAISKYHSTEIFRKVINDAMDIAGGSAIIRGPRNLLANAYFSIPISITVEGSNIITRSLMQFGQGSIMSHPFSYSEITSLEKNDIKSFDKALFGHIYHIFNNKVRSLLLSITRGYLHKPSHKGIVGKYERKISWASARFAYLTDIVMISYGGNLKRKEKINGRFGDILSYLYLATCILRKFIADGEKKEDEHIVHFTMQNIFYDIQNSFEDLLRNIFSNKLLKILILPIRIFYHLNPLSSPSNDKLQNTIVSKYLKPGKCRDNLTSGIYIPKDIKEALGRLENAFMLQEKSYHIIQKIKDSSKSGLLPNNKPESLLKKALDKKIINNQEFKLATNAVNAIYDAIQVDDYPYKKTK